MSEPGPADSRIKVVTRSLFPIVTFQSFATVVHTPQCGCVNENYSHCDIRILKGERDPSGEPDPEQNVPKSKDYKVRRHAWRSQIRNQLKIELRPGD